VYSAVAEEAPKTEEQVGAEAARVKKHAYIAARKYKLLLQYFNYRTYLAVFQHRSF